MLLNKQVAGTNVWVLILNKYQRDNLLFLLNVLGYGAGTGIEPFTILHNGDWVGEIALMLGKQIDWSFDPKETYTVNEDDTPNTNFEEVERRVQLWVDSL